MNTLLTLVLALAVTPAPDGEGAIPERAGPWPEEIVALAESLPIQEGGRIKPLHTFASFTLLRLNGKRSIVTPDDERLGPVEWLLDVLFYPEAASRQTAFLVQNPEVVEAIGVDLDDKEARDRYSFDELEPGVSRLFQLAHEYAAIEEKDRTSVQQQIVFLAGNVDTFLQLVGNVGTLAVVPPTFGADEVTEWITPTELFLVDAEGQTLDRDHADVLAGVASLARNRDDPVAFERDLADLHETLLALAEARGEGQSVALELAYYKADLMYWSLNVFGLAFLLTAATWLRPRNRLFYRGSAVLVSAATAILATGIVLRCVIRGRPPVSTLYETVLFVTVVGVLVALFLELVNRRRVALSAAAILGLVGMFVANGYEVLDKKDTMPSLVAVLDTNFWLATHVTAITIGYSAGMLAALLASLYLLGKLVGWKRHDRAAYASLGRMTYGVLCFAMIFSLVGTILGGIWANDSWGRFWGWDPKENGALLIVISQVAILHARRGGYLRDHGIAMAAAFSGTIIAFSWWGVNLLGVGLHSYGFTSGISRALWTYYGIQWAIVAAGGLALLRSPRAA